MTQKAKNWSAAIAVTALGLGAGALFGPGLLAAFKSPVEYSGHGNPVDKSATVAEQTRAAQLIVKARVMSVENRLLTEVLPVYAEDGVTVTEEREMSTPFTDVTFLISDTLKGKADNLITVLQTGGTLDNGRLGRAQKFAIAGDPLFVEGSEHILFLVDITNDGVHSTGRKLYRTVNAMGRYQVEPDGSLIGPASLHPADDLAALRQLPQTEDQLRTEIESVQRGQ